VADRTQHCSPEPHVLLRTNHKEIKLQHVDSSQCRNSPPAIPSGPGERGSGRGRVIQTHQDRGPGHRRPSAQCGAPRSAICWLHTPAPRLNAAWAVRQRPIHVRSADRNPPGRRQPVKIIHGGVVTAGRIMRRRSREVNVCSGPMATYRLGMWRAAGCRIQRCQGPVDACA